MHGIESSTSHSESGRIAKFIIFAFSFDVKCSEADKGWRTRYRDQVAVAVAG